MNHHLAFLPSLRAPQIPMALGVLAVCSRTAQARQLVDYSIQTVVSSLETPYFPVAGAPVLVEVDGRTAFAGSSLPDGQTPFFPLDLHDRLTITLGEVEAQVPLGVFSAGGMTGCCGR
jgi:hypothetical protein